MMSEAQAKIDAIAKRRADTSGIEQALSARDALIRQMMPNPEQFDRFKRILLTTVMSNPRLRQCTPQSIVLAAYEAASLGLEMTNALGYAFVIPYGNKAQFQLGYKGMAALAWRAGIVLDMQTVHEADEEDGLFEYNLGTNRYVRFRKSKQEDRGQLAYAYAVARIKASTALDDVTNLVVMTRAEVLERRNASKAYARDIKGSPWATHPAAMWKKTPVRELSKLLPQAPLLQHAAAVDELRDEGHRVSYIEAQDATDEINELVEQTGDADGS